MDSWVLVKPDVSLGESIAVALRADSGLQVNAALWWFEEAADQMRFMVATALYTDGGPIQAYRRINDSLTKSGINLTQLRDLWVVPSDHKIVLTLSEYISENATHFGFQNCDYGDLHIAYAYIYFLAKPRAKTKSKRT